MFRMKEIAQSLVKRPPRRFEILLCLRIFHVTVIVQLVTTSAEHGGGGQLGDGSNKI
jgi:hypothetical protein